MDYALIISAFLAGLLTFLAPCTFPLVPGYLAFISGVSAGDLQDPTKAKQIRRKIFFNGLFFVLGFSLVFIVLGLAAGAAGEIIGTYKVWVNRLGGILVIIFALFLLGWLKLGFLQKEQAWHARFTSRGQLWTSLVLGLAFGFGWTPCIGPILGSILILAASETSAGQGALLLAIFSLGLALPFLLCAWLIGSAASYLKKFTKYLPAITKIGGFCLLILGILLFFDRLDLLIIVGFKLFGFMNYQERLLEYL